MSTEREAQTEPKTVESMAAKILRELSLAEEDSTEENIPSIKVMGSSLYDGQGKFANDFVGKFGLSAVLFIHSLAAGLVNNLIPADEYYTEIHRLKFFLANRPAAIAANNLRSYDWSLEMPLVAQREAVKGQQPQFTLDDENGEDAPEIEEETENVYPIEEPGRPVLETQPIPKKEKKYRYVDFSKYDSIMQQVLSDHEEMFRVGVLIQYILDLFHERLGKYKNLLTVADFIHPNPNQSKKGAPLFSDQGAHIIFEGIDAETHLGKSFDMAIRELSSLDLFDEVWELGVRVDLEKLLMKITPEKEDDFFQLVMRARNRVKRNFEPPKNKNAKRSQ